MTDIPAALRALNVTDIFHAEAPGGAQLICLVTSVSETAIQARAVTSQVSLIFDRRTGVASWGRDTCEIDSVEPLPAGIHEVLVALDRKYQSDCKSGFRRPEAEFRLSDTEKRALLFTRRFYAASRL